MDCRIPEPSALLPTIPTVAASAVAVGEGRDGPSDTVEINEGRGDTAVISIQRKIGVGTPEVQTKLLHVLGTAVSVVCVSFTDKFFVTISDNGKMAAMIQGAAGFEGERADFGVRFIFGDRHREYLLVYARELLAIISAQSKKELLLAISISNRPAFFKTVMEGIRTNFRFL